MKKKKINGFEKYIIYEDGRIFSLYRNKFMKFSPDKDGYFLVTLDGKTKRVHRLLALHFIKNAKNKSQINHIDGNKQNNDLGNLEWVTPKENNQHASKVLGRWRLENNPNSKLNLKKVKKIKKYLKNTCLTQRQIGKIFGVSNQTISLIKCEGVWV